MFPFVSRGHKSSPDLWWPGCGPEDDGTRRKPHETPADEPGEAATSYDYEVVACARHEPSEVIATGWGPCCVVSQQAFQGPGGFVSYFTKLKRVERRA